MQLLYYHKEICYLVYALQKYQYYCMIYAILKRIGLNI